MFSQQVVDGHHQVDMFQIVIGRKITGIVPERQIEGDEADGSILL